MYKFDATQIWLLSNDRHKGNGEIKLASSMQLSVKLTSNSLRFCELRLSTDRQLIC